MEQRKYAYTLKQSILRLQLKNKTNKLSAWKANIKKDNSHFQDDSTSRHRPPYERWYKSKLGFDSETTRGNKFI